MNDTMICSGCHKEVDSDATSTCMTSHVELDDLGLDESKACPDDLFYCPDCLNEHAICTHCQKDLSEDEQIKINVKYNPKYISK